jgi:predicted mannosyl-3-phosphoglycerate phosphatase (HAD superfamily)
MNLVNLDGLKCHPAEPSLSETSDREVEIVIESAETFI